MSDQSKQKQPVTALVDGAVMHSMPEEGLTAEQLKEAARKQDVLCSCTHARGDHWHRAQGVMECGIKGCGCSKFALPEPVPAEVCRH